MTTTLKTTLTLIRHAQVPANLRRILESRIPGPSVTEHGQRQAVELVEQLRERPLDGIAVSTMIRTAETARPLAEDRGLDPLVLGGLREISVGDLQGRADDEARATFWDIVHAWPDGDDQLRVPGGETGAKFYDRFDAAIQDCLQRGWRQPFWSATRRRSRPGRDAKQASRASGCVSIRCPTWAWLNWWATQTLVGS